MGLKGCHASGQTLSQTIQKSHHFLIIVQLRVQQVQLFPENFQNTNRRKETMTLPQIRFHQGSRKGHPSRFVDVKKNQLELRESFLGERLFHPRIARWQFPMSFISKVLWVLSIQLFQFRNRFHPLLYIPPISFAFQQIQKQRRDELNRASHPVLAHEIYFPRSINEEGNRPLSIHVKPIQTCMDIEWQGHLVTKTSKQRPTLCR